MSNTPKVMGLPIDMSGYTPRIVSESLGFIKAEVLVELQRCSICEKPMIPTGVQRTGLFPAYYQETIEAQRLRAGWETGRRICKTCMESGLVTFTCSICKEVRPSSEIQEFFGDPPEYLCTSCYETVPAKVWDAKRKELLESHKWDNE